MKKFLFKRLLQSLLIFFFVGLLIYSMMRLLPSSYVETRARTLSQQPGAKSYDEWLIQLKAAYGLEQGILSGYLHWLGNALQGDFGDSWQWNKPVITKFQEVIGYSIFLAATAFILEIFLAILAGILAANKQYSKLDHTITIVALIGISLPSFFFATILKYLFSVKLGWFDLYGIVGRMHEQYSPFKQFLDMTEHMLLPILTLTITNIGSLIRFTRTNMLEVLHSDFIRTARANGLPEHKVIYQHAFRNTLLPLITVLGSSLPELFGGALITETLFQIPGIGYTAYQSMVNGDIPFSMFYMLFLAVLTLLGNLLADILYAAVDPRVQMV